MTDQTDDELVAETRRLVSADIDGTAEWLSKIREAVFELTYRYDKSLSMLRDATNGNDTRSLVQLVSEAGLAVDRVELLRSQLEDCERDYASMNEESLGPCRRRLTRVTEMLERWSQRAECETSNNRRDVWRICIADLREALEQQP